MALHEEGVIDHHGQAKELDSGAIDMILDNLQISQYVYPVKSTLRELGSNAEDSIREKNTAIEILTGQAKVEDYYYVPGKNKTMDEAIKANPGVYKDSKFDVDYYKLECLSPNNRIEITYKQNGSKSKDVLTVRDWGVGLGDYRLHGYLKIGYSTKRLSKKPLGKWGLGAKAPLSMGVPYYQMTSVHNNRKFKMMVYSRHWESIVPEFGQYNLQGGIVSAENDYIYFYNEDGSPVLDSTGNPRKIYYEHTDEQNYSEVTVDCKKHYITDIRNAVQSQLLYFNNIDFRIINEANEVEVVDVLAPILYEDESLILSDNNQYSKPHLVINKVSYGYIDFQELELEQSYGNIGIKVVSGEVDVTPNRENVIWNDNSREIILKRFKQASRAAKRIILDSFTQTDFKEWLGACVGVFGFGNSLNETMPQVKALKQLQNIAKIRGSARPEYTPDPRIKFSGYLPDMFPGLKVRLVEKKTIQRKKVNVQEIQRMEVLSVSAMFNYPMYLQGINASTKRDEYLLSLHPEGFLLVRDSNYKSPTIDDTLEETTEADTDSLATSEEDEEFLAEVKSGKAKREANDWTLTNPLILAGMPKYEDVKVIELPEGEEPKPEETPEQKRRREQRIVIQTPRGDSMIWQKVQPKVEVLDDIDKEFYWGNNDDKDGVILAAAIVKRNSKSGLSRTSEMYGAADEERQKLDAYWVKLGADTNHDGSVYDRWKVAQLSYWSDPEARVLLGIVNKDNIKYVTENHFHITEFYNRFQDGVLTMADALIKWNTARVIRKKLSELKFLTGMDKLDNTRYTMYQELEAYVSNNFTYVNDTDLKRSIEEHLDKVQLLQEAFREDNSDDGAYALSVAKELFGLEARSGIKGAVAVDIEQIDKLNELLVWAAPIKDMLNMVHPLTSGYESITLEQEEAVRQYISWRTA